mmetsp:Transcript_6239/g.9660  ORF Transcript_6239/g.9660 Transcript_6239/m.9660 type:complete len:221 (-) Transcript_6239:986-1648(-)
MRRFLPPKAVLLLPCTILTLQMKTQGWTPSLLPFFATVSTTIGASVLVAMSQCPPSPSSLSMWPPPQPQDRLRRLVQVPHMITHNYSRSKPQFSHSLLLQVPRMPRASHHTPVHRPQDQLSPPYRVGRHQQVPCLCQHTALWPRAPFIPRKHLPLHIPPPPPYPLPPLPHGDLFPVPMAPPLPLHLRPMLPPVHLLQLVLRRCMALPQAPPPTQAHTQVP